MLKCECGGEMIWVESVAVTWVKNNRLITEVPEQTISIVAKQTQDSPIAFMQVMADCIPFIGDLLEVANDCITFLLSACLSIIVIAVAWFAYRPVLSVLLLLLVGAAAYDMRQRQKIKEVVTYAVANEHSALHQFKDNVDDLAWMYDSSTLYTTSIVRRNQLYISNNSTRLSCYDLFYSSIHILWRHLEPT